MKVDKETGLLQSIPFHFSPHHNDRPTLEINLLVVHGISLPPKVFGNDYIDQFFLGKLNQEDHPYFKEISHLRVAPHVLIKRDGTLIQYVPFHKRAWHAGESEFQGRSGCNDFSIGIELEGDDDTPYEVKQYQQLAKLTELLMQEYAIPLENIVGHSDIAPGRKQDPGPAFDWQYFKSLL